MKKYSVMLEERRWLEVEIEAGSEADALYVAQLRYGGGEINLDANSGASVMCKGRCGGVEMKMGAWNA